MSDRILDAEEVADLYRELCDAAAAGDASLAGEVLDALTVHDQALRERLRTAETERDAARVELNAWRADADRERAAAIALQSGFKTQRLRAEGAEAAEARVAMIQTDLTVLEDDQSRLEARVEALTQVMDRLIGQMASARRHNNTTSGAPIITSILDEALAACRAALASSGTEPTALGVPVAPQEARCPTCGSDDPKMDANGLPRVVGDGCFDAWHSVVPQETEAG